MVARGVHTCQPSRKFPGRCVCYDKMSQAVGKGQDPRMLLGKRYGLDDDGGRLYG